ncbi:PREDICTED: uncharacterized protein LOC104825309 [Tarenaya hassleriana]|uniref:uncharacterized protein LOC104825309 n=1 Tax=Tarenaya hassleriana TaxID=28532 RepID=UPI00053C3C0F|nr:PREDICTED: uncharacterized protein LOC104825309 [Tarenaya hassleriana]
MGESACLVHSFSYTASISRESHEENPLHALSQSISFGRFMTESLEWGKWSSFSHKKYVEEAEKFSRPGSVAQKKAFFEAHYKRKAEAKKGAAVAADETPEQPLADSAVSPNPSESDPLQNQEVKECASEIGTVTGSDGSGLNVEKNESGRKSLQIDAEVSEKVPDVENSICKPVVADDNKGLDDVMVPSVENSRKENSSVGNEDEVEELPKKDGVEGRRSLTKNSPGWRVSVEISAPPRTSDAAKKTSFSENRSERIDHTSLNKDEIPIRRRFGFLNCLMTKSKTHDQNPTRKKGRKQEKKPKKKRSLCLCFKPQALGDTEAPKNHAKKVKGKSQSRKL